MSLNHDLLALTACFSNLNDIDNLTRASKETLTYFKSLDKNSEPVVHKRKLIAKKTTIAKIRKLKPRVQAEDNDDVNDLDDFLKNNLNDDLRNDFDVMMEAVKKNGRNLRFASVELKANHEIVLEAVKNGMALDFASENLRANREIVLEAVKNSDYAIQYASLNLRSDPEILDVVENMSELEDGWEETWRNDDTPQRFSVYYENNLTSKVSFKRPVGKDFAAPPPIPKYYYYEMMTVAELRDLLKGKNVKFTTKHKKNELQELVRKTFSLKAR